MIKSLYQNIGRPILFRLDAELVHTRIVGFGELLGKNEEVCEILADIYSHKSSGLSQDLFGIKFTSPIGLAAGFDYEARLTQILPSLGFGFQTIGSITNLPYEGNSAPRLSRMPKSKSLLVNKGFKNLGALKTISRLRGKNFSIPVGISIGRTNSKEMISQKESIFDIVSAFIKFEDANIGNKYYELNISCPNLFGPVSFYPPTKLHELLSEIDKLKLTKPVFVKMPISENTNDIARMLEIICLHSPVGVILGNLQKDRSLLHPSESLKFEKFKGGVSGKPTFNRSNDLISLAYKNFGGRIKIIGCGGVFSAPDAFEKIIRGASLVQLITGMVYEGPQLISEINRDLATILKHNGFKNVSQAVGSGVQ